MIDTNFLNNFQTHYPKETGELKFILNLINDIYVHYNYYKDNIINQSRIYKNFGKNLLNFCQMMTNEYNEYKEEDLSNLKDVLGILLELSDQLGIHFFKF